MVIPGAAFFYAAAHVPAGVLSITVGMVPIVTFVAAAVVGLEKFAVGRVLGVVLGTLAVVLLVAPEGSLPDPAQLPWVFLGFVSAACYAALSLVLALTAPPGANSLMLTFGMFVVASLLMVPILYATGSFVPFGWPLGHRRMVVVGARCRQRGGIHALFHIGRPRRSRLQQFHRQHGDAFRCVLGNCDFFRAELDLGVAVIRHDNGCTRNGSTARQDNRCRGKY
jgi:hypothetical protein